MKREIAKNEKVIKQHTFTYCLLTNAQAVPVQPSAPAISPQLELHLCLFLALHDQKPFGQYSQRDPDPQLLAEQRSQVPTPLQYFLEDGSDAL